MTFRTANTAADPHDPPCGRIMGRVVSNDALGSLRWLTIEVPGWRSANPGQFAMLQIEASRFFLGRPLSVADEVGHMVSFLVSPVGGGTGEISHLAVDAKVWVLGPLGNGFDMQTIAGTSRLVVVAGGVGVAPFPLLLSRLAGQARVVARPGLPASRRAFHGASGLHGSVPSEIVVLLGFRDEQQTLGARPVIDAVSRIEQLGLPCRLVLVAEDGSQGSPAKVTDALSQELFPHDRLAVCGPAAMSASVWRLCRTVVGVQAWFSLEASMACGVGSCHGCGMRMADGSIARVCRDGPVFSGEGVFGDGLLPLDQPEKGLT